MGLKRLGSWEEGRFTPGGNHGGGGYNYEKIYPWVTSSIGGWGIWTSFIKKGLKLGSRTLVASEVLT